MSVIQDSLRLGERKVAETQSRKDLYLRLAVDILYLSEGLVGETRGAPGSS